MRLLLAEDEKELSNTIKRVLEYNKYDVDAAYDGQEALDYILCGTYDGVIMDVMMPKMDGITVVRKVRATGNNVPILVLTAKAETDDKVLGLDAGADDYLTKPFVIKELLARIRAITRRKGDIIENYSFGNIVLNPNTFELSGSKNKCRLTAKEYKLMEFLIRNKDIVASTEKIMESIWEYDSDAEINVVWVFISALRKKMEQVGANCEIKAIKGVGYHLEVKKNG